jgi:hypothetical protein
MIVTTAESVLELSTQAPGWVEDRAGLCSPALAYFDATTGFLQFNTNCAGSRNTWTQTVLFDEWDSIVDIREPVHPWGPLIPETDEEREEREERERLEEETTILGTESWPEVLAKFPQLSFMDAKVHCDCPAFLWWGSQYNLEQRDTALNPAGVPFPHVRDPGLNNIICKHLEAVFTKHF